MDRITVGKKVIGEGGFGKVFLGTFVVDPKTGKKIQAAIKQIPARRMDIEEYKLQSELSKTPECNAHIACMYSLSYKGGNYYIAMEYIKGNDLFHYLLADDNHITDSKLRRFFRDCLQGLTFIHKSGMAHGDIKLENLMYDKPKDQVKFIDFGFGCTKETCKTSTVFHGTRYLEPPEYRKAKKNLTTLQRADVWALGSTLAEMLMYRRTGDVRLGGASVTPKTDVVAIVKHYAPGHPDVFYRIIKGMMEYNPIHRWTAAQALKELQTSKSLQSFLAEPRA